MVIQPLSDFTPFTQTLIPMAKFTRMKTPTSSEFYDFINDSPVEIIEKEETEQIYNTGGQMYRKINYSFKVPFDKVEYEEWCMQKCLMDLLRNYCDNQRIQHGAIEDILAKPKDNFDQEITLSGEQKSVLLNYGKIWDKLLDS